MKKKIIDPWYNIFWLTRNTALMQNFYYNVNIHDNHPRGKKCNTLYSCFWLVGRHQQGVAHLPSGVTCNIICISAQLDTSPTHYI